MGHDLGPAAEAGVFVSAGSNPGHLVDKRRTIVAKPRPEAWHLFNRLRYRGQ